MRTALPEDFADRLDRDSLDELQAIFAGCAIDARGGDHGATAIGFVNCPDELLAWLVERGLSPDAPDASGRTPMMARAETRWRSRVDQIPLLLSLGASADQLDACLDRAAAAMHPEAVGVLLDAGATVEPAGGSASPLLIALRRAQNNDVVALAEIAHLLLDRGAKITPEMRAEVQRIGEGFERYRDAFNPDTLAATDGALRELNRLFAVEPAKAREPHDGLAPIEVPDGAWFEQHKALWGSLVPPRGAAPTAQGEVIRVTGVLAHELLDNGAANWSEAHRAALSTLPTLLALAEPLPDADLREAKRIVVRGRDGALSEREVSRLEQLAVEWVQRNPLPLPAPGKSDAH